MSKAFSAAFYASPAWKRQRELYRELAHGLCESCGDVGEIVHHKEPLTPENIDDPRYTLSVSNLQLLCRACHKRVHDAANDGAYFDQFGDLHPAQRR